MGFSCLLAEEAGSSAAGDEEGARKLLQQREAMYQELKADLKYENLAAISYLAGKWNYYRELTGDTSTTI